MHKKFLALSVLVFMSASLAADCDGKCPMPEKVKAVVSTPLSFFKQHKTATIVTGCIVACALYAYKNGFFSAQEEEQE